MLWNQSHSATTPGAIFEAAFESPRVDSVDDSSSTGSCSSSSSLSRRKKAGSSQLQHRCWSYLCGRKIQEQPPHEPLQGPEAQSAGKSWKWSRSQQRLSVISLVWLLSGLWMYMRVRWNKNAPHYTFIQSLYVMTQIVTTIGYGDFTPSEDVGYICIMVYVLTAVLVLSSIVSALAETVVKTEDSLIRGALGKASCVVTVGMQDRRRRSASTEQAEKDSLLNDNEVADGHKSDWMLEVFPDMQPASVGFLRAVLIWSLFVVVGTVFFTHCPGEEREVIEALYMSVITLTTVGFGDKTPRTDTGRLFSVFWMFFGVGSFAHLVAKFAAFRMAQDRLVELDHRTLLDIQCDELFMKCHVECKEGVPPKVTRADFILFMMKQMGILDTAVVEQLSHNFDDLDRDGSGFLDQDDIELFNRRLAGTLDSV